MKTQRYRVTCPNCEGVSKMTLEAEVAKPCPQCGAILAWTKPTDTTIFYSIPELIEEEA